MQKMIGLWSFFCYNDHRLFGVGGHYLFADEDIRQGLEIVDKFGVIVGEE